MKVKLIYKNNLVKYVELPDSWYNRNQIKLPKEKELNIVGNIKDISIPILSNLVFRHIRFKKSAGELLKVMKQYE